MITQYSAQHKTRLLQVARKALQNYLENKTRTKFVEESAEMLCKRAVFVTLRKKDSGELRGCIGQTEARCSLIEAVARTAVSSAVDDSRFPAVTLHELPNLLIEINVLTPMYAITAENVVVGKHGLLLIKGCSRGLFLPEVAVSQGWDRLTLLDELCRKAELPKGSWRDADAELLAFESEAWEEK
ncbi:MAG: AmmeMemoRadiSam system protein A [SAR324 cluster bacterium]|nr:AmmeMemoRadiSam system protein A [SAR324 cluster bacterium]MBL7035194.1 AmmeMemoRadiSam system protein A [SAR324 cluster bacterium]